MSMSTFHLTLYEPLSLQQFNFPHTINSYYTFIKYDLITTISEHTFVTLICYYVTMFVSGAPLVDSPSWRGLLLRFKSLPILFLNEYICLNQVNTPILELYQGDFVVENAHHNLIFQGVNTEHVDQWIGFWTQDQKVWGLIPTAGHV